VTQRERERDRGRDTYDNVLAIDKANRERGIEGQVVVHGAAIGWQRTRDASGRPYLVASRVSGEAPRTVVDDWVLTVQQIKTRTGRHRHPGGVVIYVVEGRGHSVIDEQRLDWEPGDLLVLPQRPEGVEHQHFNDNPQQPARLVTFANVLMRDWLAGSFAAVASAPDYHPSEHVGGARRDLHAQVAEYADRAARRAAQGQVVVRGADLPWRQNRQALVRRYMWSSRGYGVESTTALDDWRVFAQHIRTHSGRHRHQGGLVIYCLEGEGISELAGERMVWEAGDVLLLPFNGEGGYEHQHFNKDDANPARWIAFNNSTSRIWTGSQMTQISQHPDFREND
jgi:quercetin dioxygenase-like cupin family protein